MEEEILINNNSNTYQNIIYNMEQSIETMILYRSLYLLKKKFEKYKSNINKIYNDYNINKSKRIDVLGSCQININFLDEVALLVLKETNLFILELSSPKDLFLSYFLITNQKGEEMNLILKDIKKEIIEKKLLSKYNKIFYDKKIRPLFKKNDIIKNDNNKEEEITNDRKIVEYNKRGKIKKYFEQLIIENESNKKEIKKRDKEINNIDYNNISDNNNNIKDNIIIDDNILYIETLPLIIADYLQEHKNIAIVEIEEELSKELDLIFNKELLIKINEYDELMNKYKNYNRNNDNIGKELKKYSLKLKQIQKNIKLYQQIIIDKKTKNENTIFLEDMLNKLLEKETLIQQKINEKKQNLNKNEKNIIKNKIKNNNNFGFLDLSTIKNTNNNINNSNSNNNLLKYKLTIGKEKIINNENKIISHNKNNYSSLFITSQSNKMILNQNTKNSLLNTTSKKIILLSDFSEDKIENSLKEIFLFYSNDNKINDNNDDNKINNEYLDILKFKKFCLDFKIPLSNLKINNIFKESCNNNIEGELTMNFDEFKYSLNKISLEIYSFKKQKLLKKISEKKNLIDFMELKECQRQEEERNHNKFTERITGGIAKKSMEKNQYEYINKYKKVNEDITKYEFIYQKECKKNEKEILDNFYKFLGIYSNYKNKLNRNKNNIFYKGETQNNNINIETQESDINQNLFISKNPIKIINPVQNNSFRPNISKNILFRNSNKINWNQMQNIHFDYNPIYGNNFKNNNKINETDSDEEIIKKLSKSRFNNKLIKNHSALELKGVNKNNILPPIRSNNPNKIENNLRYYNNNIISKIENKNNYNEELLKVDENKNYMTISSLKEEKNTFLEEN